MRPDKTLDNVSEIRLHQFVERRFTSTEHSQAVAVAPHPIALRLPVLT